MSPRERAYELIDEYQMWVDIIKTRGGCPTEDELAQALVIETEMYLLFKDG